MCSCAVTSERQRVDTGGWCLMKNLEALSCTIISRAGSRKADEHMTKSPRPFPLHLHTAGDQRLDEVGMAWE